ncbi:PREDICTED: transcription initiation factor TFIID subunit 4b isoform X2 [Nicotiana attenuata]|uniref:Transcription initiation factor tfiid subunit 4b n=1 Tax=Nicotiana attenuata TaxID=49451 RepID=A0A1J6KM13_NICAT|nr:PREDICTED: transcription initiation factor TFIID subunit 4b isoform X2 [Nicotiana attenuata]OIT22783.1 transcription initiation factor tfiid subunit 4b [Nicotiana attenuata]
MDPSIMKLLEEDEDETMHSGADVDAFTAALNRDIGGADNSQSQPSDSDSVPLSQGSSYTSNQFASWQTSNHDENGSRHSLQESETVQQKEGNISDMQLKGHGTDSQNQQQKNDSSQEISSLPLQHISSHDTYQTTEVEQDTLHSSKAVNIQNPEKNTQNPESQHLNLQGAQSQQSMQSLTTGTSGLPLVAADASNQSESATGSSSQSAINVAKQGKQVPFAMLFPHIQPQLDKDRAMQLQTLYVKLKKNEISKEGFVRHMRSIIGDQMLKMAVYKFQSQASRNSPSVPSQFPQSAASQQQHSQMPTDDSSNMAIESNAQKLREVENQADLRGAQGNQMPSSSLIAVKQERDHSPFPIQGLNRQQQQHLHFSQASFPTFPNAGNNYSAYSASNVNSSTTQPLKQQSDDAQMRQFSAQQNRNVTQLGVPTQAMGMMSAPKFEKQNTFGEAKRLPGGSLNIPSTSRIQQPSVQWQQSANKEQKSILSSPMTNLKSEPIDHFHDQLQRSQLSPFSSVQVEQGNSTSESSKDESIEQISRIGLSTTTSMKPSNSASSSMSSQMDTSTLLSSRATSVTSLLGPGNNGKTPVKKPSIGQKKPLDTLGSSPPPSGKKQKVSGAFLDQSIEQLNDVTAVSGVNLREEEEQLFSGPKEDSRVSEASRRVVQEEEERLILQKIPLQKKLTEIMAKCGLKNMSNDVERCLSLCVEERMRGLISSLIRLSKQRVDIEKSRHRTIVTSDVREEILSINRKAREEWEKKQADVEKLQKANEPEGSNGVDGDKEKDDGRGKSIKANKEEDDKMRTTAANVAARAAVGGDDMLSKWQLMAEQARQKREGGGDVASGSQPSKDVTRRNLSTPTRTSKDHQEAENRSQSSAKVTPGAVRRAGRNQVITQTRIARSITVKDVIAVLEREPQMSKSTLIYRLYEKARSNASAESS